MEVFHQKARASHELVTKPAGCHSVHSVNLLLGAAHSSPPHPLSPVLIPHPPISDHSDAQQLRYQQRRWWLLKNSLYRHCRFLEIADGNVACTLQQYEKHCYSFNSFPFCVSGEMHFHFLPTQTAKSIMVIRT